MVALFVKLVAIYALRDSRAWGDKPRVGDDTVALISAIPALCVPSLTYLLVTLLRGASWSSSGIDNNVLIGIGLWCTACYLFVRSAASKLQEEIHREIGRLASLPKRRWKLVRNFTVSAVPLFILVICLGSVIVVGIYGRN